MLYATFLFYSTRFTFFFLPPILSTFMKPISEEIRDKIILLIDQQLTTRQIKKRVGVSHTTVNNVRRKYRENACVNQGGRPRKLTATDQRRLCRIISAGKVDNAVQVTKELRDVTNAKVSVQTVRRVLKKSGMKAVVKRKKPMLLSRHKRQRLNFALKYKHWTVEDWKRVVWSDETKINRVGSDGREYVWIGKDRKRGDQHYSGTVKFGGGSLMIWGCMTAKGVGYACRINGTMNAQLYVDIIRNVFVRSLELNGLDVGNIIFQQDNDSKHTSHLARKWFQDNKVELLDWPAQSPDLNPMEHIWCQLKSQLAKYENDPVSMQELWQRVDAEWIKISQTFCMNLIESMPRRISAVVKAKGGSTKY
jgi:transposase